MQVPLEQVVSGLAAHPNNPNGLANPMAVTRDQQCGIGFESAWYNHELQPGNGRSTTAGSRPKAMQGCQATIGCDNSPSVAWTTRMATRSASPVSFRLLKGFAMRQQTTRSSPPAVYHVAGVMNELANIASCPVPGVASHYHLLEASAMCPNTILTIFNSTYPLPQKPPWRNVQLPSNLWLNVISTLRGQRLGL
jgi:hypothetical protein